MARRLLVLAAALFALSAPSASAATICVYPESGCDESWLSLQDAIDSAAVNPAARDTIKINPGPALVEDTDVGPTNLVDIVGAGGGPGGTVLRSLSSDYALDVQSAGSTVSNLRLIVGPQVGGFEGGLALSGAGATADGITVTGESGIDQATGVQLRTNAILRNSLVELPSTGIANYAIRAEESTLIENVSAAGDAMVRALDPGPPVVVRRLRSSSRSTIGVTVGGAGSVEISDSLIRLSGGTSGAGLMAETNLGGARLSWLGT